LGYISSSNLVVSTLADSYFLFAVQDLNTSYVFQMLSDLSDSSSVLNSNANMDALLVSGSDVYIGIGLDFGQAVMKLSTTYTPAAGLSVTKTWMMSFLQDNSFTASSLNFPTDFALGTYDD